MHYTFVFFILCEDVDDGFRKRNVNSQTISLLVLNKIVLCSNIGKIV